MKQLRKMSVATASLVSGLLLTSMLTGTPATAQTAEQIAAAKAAHQPAIPYTPGKHIYPAIEQAHADVDAALALARKTHKRVILDFGADWCGDCQVLDIYFHQSPNVELVDKYFIEVKVNIGQEDANLDIAHRFGVPVHGVPALAVVRSDGSVVVSQDKEFSDMRYMQASNLTDFLNKWKATGAASAH